MGHYDDCRPEYDDFFSREAKREKKQRQKVEKENARYHKAYELAEKTKAGKQLIDDIRVFNEFEVEYFKKKTEIGKKRKDFDNKIRKKLGWHTYD